MSKITLSSVPNLIDGTTAANTINLNFQTIQNAFDNTLSRDGLAPDFMQSNLDMNSNQIINLPQPLTSTSPLRLQDLNSFIGGGTITNIPIGGTTGQILAKLSNANYAVGWISESAELTAGTNIVLTGSTPTTISTSLTPTFTSVNGATIPTVADTLVGRATTDTLTNKTINGASNTLSSIANSSLTNSSITLGTTSISLGGSTTSLAGLNQCSFSGTNPTLLMNNSFTGGFPSLQLQSARGSIGSPTALQANDYMFVLAGYGYNGSTYTQAGSIFSQATETFSTGHAGTQLQFYTIPTGTATLGEALRLQASGGASIGPANTATDPGINNILVTDIFTNNATFMHRSKTTLTNGAGVGAGTITNAPSAGNPTKWIAIDDNGTTRKIPAW